jgi:hypothetical protein
VIVSAEDLGLCRPPIGRGLGLGLFGYLGNLQRGCGRNRLARQRDEGKAEGAADLDEHGDQRGDDVADVGVAQSAQPAECSGLRIGDPSRYRRSMQPLPILYQGRFKFRSSP